MDTLSSLAETVHADPGTGESGRFVAGERGAASGVPPVDITPFINARTDADGNPVPVFLYWKEPRVCEVYQIGPDAETLLRRNPEWSAALAVEVATLGAIHAAPDPGGLAPGLFYEQIANGPNPRFYLYLSVCLKERFPYLGDALPIETLKKMLVTPSDPPASEPSAASSPA